MEKWLKAWLRKGSRRQVGLVGEGSEFGFMRFLCVDCTVGGWLVSLSSIYKSTLFPVDISLPSFTSSHLLSCINYHPDRERDRETANKDQDPAAEKRRPHHRAQEEELGGSEEGY